MVAAAMQAGIAKLADGRIVLQPRSVDRGSAVSRGGGGAGPLIPEPLLVCVWLFLIVWWCLCVPWRVGGAGGQGNVFVRSRDTVRLGTIGVPKQKIERNVLTFGGGGGGRGYGCLFNTLTASFAEKG